jgi:hypothetical protein
MFQIFGKYDNFCNFQVIGLHFEFGHIKNFTSVIKILMKDLIYQQRSVPGRKPEPKSET